MYDRCEDWLNELNDGETLCYLFAPVSGDDRIKTEAAMIYQHKPPLNMEYVDHFPYSDTEMELLGKIDMLTESFFVEKC